MKIDNDLPKYIVTLISHQRPIESIREELLLFLDSKNDSFVDWLNDYLNGKKSNNQQQSANDQTNNTSNKKQLEVISANEIENEDELLDFEEENIDELNDLSERNEQDNEQNNQLNSSNDSSNKRKLNDLEDDNSQNEDESNKRLLNNNNELVRLNKKESNVIKLTDNRQLNDIGQMRRKAMEEKNKLENQQPQQKQRQPQQQSNESNESNESNPEFYDLREKLNKTKAKNKDNDDDLEETMEFTDDEKLDEDNDEEKKEKCKFWPLCKKENECIFYHPTKHCDNFLNCKFSAEKCLDIHPLCKFDANCTKVDCSFLHIAKKQLHLPTLIQQQPMTVECKFYPKCYNLNCPFIHPKMCIYGVMCKNQTTCPFKHPEASQNIAKPYQCKFVAKNVLSSNNESPANEDSLENEEENKIDTTDEQIEDETDLEIRVFTE